MTDYEILHQAKFCYARACARAGYELQLDDPGDLQTALDLLQDEDYILQRALDLYSANRIMGGSRVEQVETEGYETGDYDDDDDDDEGCFGEIEDFRF